MNLYEAILTSKNSENAVSAKVKKTDKSREKISAAAASQKKSAGKTNSTLKNKTSSASKKILFKKTSPSTSVTLGGFVFEEVRVATMPKIEGWKKRK